MELLYALEEIRTPLLNGICQGITYFGQEVICLMLVCFLLWCKDKKAGYQMAFAFFLSSIVAQFMKLAFRIERPWVIDPDFKPVDSALEGASGYSFPSGHTQTGVAVYGTMAVESKKRISRILWILLCIAIGFSRMYLGVHQPKDVAGGLFIALFFLILVYVVKPLEHRKWDIFVTALLMILAFATLGYDLYLYQNQIIDYAMASDSAKCAGGMVGFALGYFLERRYVDYGIPDGKKTLLIRYALGMLILGVLYVGLKACFSALSLGMPGDFFRYFVLVLWCIVLYPVLFTKFKL